MFRLPKDHPYTIAVNQPKPTSAPTANKNAAIEAAQSARNAGISATLLATLHHNNETSYLPKELVSLIAKYTHNDPDQAIEKLQKELNDLQNPTTAPTPGSWKK